QRAPIVSRTSLRRVSSNSSKFSGDSHSSHSTSSTAGRLSSDTSTRPSSRCTTCICSVLTWKFRSLPQFGQVNVTNDSPFDDFPCPSSPTDYLPDRQRAFKHRIANVRQASWLSRTRRASVRIRFYVMARAHAMKNGQNPCPVAEMSRNLLTFSRHDHYRRFLHD